MKRPDGSWLSVKTDRYDWASAGGQSCPYHDWFSLLHLLENEKETIINKHFYENSTFMCP